MLNSSIALFVARARRVVLNATTSLFLTFEREKPLFVGHNAPFDWMFVAYYFAWAGIENPFGYNALDTKALAMGKHRCFFKATNKERLLELYPRLVPLAKERVHNALGDAEFQADILCALLDD